MAWRSTLLIARGRQGVLTVAFAVGVVFNVTAKRRADPAPGLPGGRLGDGCFRVVLLVPFWMTMRAENSDTRSLERRLAAHRPRRWSWAS